jgi:hypothetical protein
MVNAGGMGDLEDGCWFAWVPMVNVQYCETDPDDTTVDVIKRSLKQALAEAKRGERLPLSSLWDEVES